MKYMLALAAVVAMVSAPFLVGGAAAAPEPANGQALFRANCAVCHGGDGSGAIGPDLHGVVNRHAAGDPDFAFSAALRHSGKTWTPTELQAFLVRPQAAVPGTRMTYPGAAPADAVAIVAYLGTLK